MALQDVKPDAHPVQAFELIAVSTATNRLFFGPYTCHDIDCHRRPPLPLDAVISNATFSWQDDTVAGPFNTAITDGGVVGVPIVCTDAASAGYVLEQTAWEEATQYGFTLPPRTLIVLPTPTTS